MDERRPVRRIAGWHALTIAAMAAGLASPLAAVPIPEPNRPRPQPTPLPPTLGHGCRAPSRPLPPREPTPAELRAKAKRERKAARRLELARRAG